MSIKGSKTVQSGVPGCIGLIHQPFFFWKEKGFWLEFRPPFEADLILN